MGEKRFPWKGNFLKIPPKVRAELDRIDGDLVAVAAVKSVRVADVEAGLYSHLGLNIDLLDGSAKADGPRQPPEDAGKWSYRNARGWDRKRPDLPMAPKSFVFESPNFGDAARNGTHTHYQTRQVYQHQVFEPQGMEIEPVIMSQPVSYIRGSGQFGSYFGAKFADDLVVFENLRYGNALYILYDDWDDISKRSRLDLLRDHDAKFDRVVHAADWQFQFNKIMKMELTARRRGKGRRSGA